MRPCRASDSLAVTALFNQRALRFLGVADTDQADIDAMLTLPGRDLAQVTVTAWDATGTLVGFGYISHSTNATITVANTVVDESIEMTPAHRELVELVAQKAATHRREIIHEVAAADEPLITVLRDLALREVRRFDLMTRTFTSKSEAPIWPVGIEPRPFDIEHDLNDVHHCLTEAFRDHYGGGFRSIEEFQHDLVDQPSFDPSLVSIAHANGEIVGTAISLPTFPEQPGFGYLCDLAVTREWRRRGLGSALLLHSFGRLREHGCDGCALHVDTDSKTNASRLYTGAGMTAHTRYVGYGR